MPLDGKTMAQTRPLKSRRKCPLPSVSKTKKIGQSHNTLVIKWLQDHVLQKKVLSNLPVFPIFIVNCTAWCRGKQGLP
ncbi:MAG: hypothetical protein ABSE90_02435 [Verrucomicrobiota bacterium]